MTDDCHMHETLCAKDQWYNSLHQMNFDYIPKGNIFGELATEHHLVSYPALHYKDICKRYLKLTDMDSGSCEQIAEYHSSWYSAVQWGVMKSRKKEKPTVEYQKTSQKAGRAI